MKKKWTTVWVPERESTTSMAPALEELSQTGYAVHSIHQEHIEGSTTGYMVIASKVVR
jgi:hypothetical protein